jgi:hypothetical protein
LLAERPALVVPEADSEIPSKVWSAWIPNIGKREITRVLTEGERKTLELRENTLRAGLAPDIDSQADNARSALHAMLGGFRSLRERDQDAEAAVEVLLAVLRDFPVWAIEEGCLRIAQRRTGLHDPPSERWPPSDAQIHAVVSKVVEPYRETLAKTQALLAAPVEELPAITARPTRTALESKLGRAIADRESRAGFAAPREHPTAEQRAAAEAQLNGDKAKALAELEADAA